MLISHIENIHAGEAITVVDGMEILCPNGCCCIGEYYGNIKGLPLIVLGIAPPLHRNRDAERDSRRRRPGDHRLPSLCSDQGVSGVPGGVPEDPRHRGRSESGPAEVPGRSAA
jgi:hypothetical protein